MSTRANFYIKVDHEHYQQYYSHCDGYRAGLGEDLRKILVYSLGYQILTPSSKLQDIVNEVISLDVREDNNGCGKYNREDIYSVTERNGLHADIEYIYLIDFNFQKGCSLYGKACWNTYHKETVGEVVNDLCRAENLIDLRTMITKK